jgi:hypothetical protein
MNSSTKPANNSHTSTLPDGQIARVIDGLICPCCARPLRPFDIEMFDDGTFRIVCPNSGADLIAVSLS